MQLLRFSLFLFTLVFSLCIEAKNPISLWSIEKEQGTAHLLGSIHLLKEEMYPLPKMMTEVLLQTDRLVVEVNLLELDPQKVGAIIRQEAFYANLDAGGLEADLEPETLKLLHGYLKSTGGNLDAIKQLRAWYLSITIAMAEMAKRGYNPELGIDQKFMQTARSTGKEIIQLETFEDQVRLLAGDSAYIQNLALRVLLEDMPELDSQINSLINSWKIGDADQMYENSVKDANRYPQLIAQTEKLLDHRNQRMATKIESLLQQPGNLLIVVGALHIGGEKGLLKLLGENHKISQIRD